MESGSVIAGPGKLLQETPLKLKSPSLPPHFQENAITSVEANSVQFSSVQTLKNVLYKAYDVRFEVRKMHTLYVVRSRRKKSGFLSELRPD